MSRNESWLIAAIILLMGFTGLWRTVKRIEGLIAFGQLDPAAGRVSRRMQRFRWLSLLLGIAALAAYWYGQPFDGRMWWLVGGWTFLSLNLVGEGLRVLKQVEEA
jgi:hypothetical protein